MLSEAGQYIKKKDLINESDRVLCMVSGGADSVAMLHMLHSLSRVDQPAFPGTFSLGVCHVNYGRRGEASDGDEDFVRRLGDELGLTVHAVRAPAEDQPNFQAWARDFRYLAAQNLCKWQGYNKIAVGHNKDDRVETMIYRLITYSGRRSLAVMPPRRGRVVRPLLYLLAEQVRNYCDESGLDYREDRSNRSLDYTRNRIRQLVVPRLEEIRPDFRDRVLDTLELLEDEDAVLEAVTAEAWRQAVINDGEEGKALKAPVLAQMPRATARLVARRWLAGGSSRVRISRRVLDSVVDLCRESSGSKNLSLSEGLTVERRYDRLLLLKQGPDAPRPVPDSVILPVPGKAVFGGYEIEAGKASNRGAPPGSPLEVTLDAAGLALPLVVRSWRPGDRFNPLGLGGSKSVQDLLVDEKIPRSHRRDIPLVMSGNTIAWVCGLRMSEDFKVTSRSEQLITLKARRRPVDSAV